MSASAGATVDAAPTAERATTTTRRCRGVEHHAPQRCSSAALRRSRVVAFLYFVLPQLAGLERHVAPHRARATRCGCCVALVLERPRSPATSVLFRAVFVRGERAASTGAASYQITMAGLAATRLFAAAGAGGVALTAWALRRSGMARARGRRPDGRFLVLLYAVYMVALVIVRRRPLRSASSAARRRSRSRSCRRSSALIADRCSALRSRSCPTDIAAPARAAVARRGAGAPAGSRSCSRRPGAVSAGVRDGDRASCASATRRCSARSSGGASTSRCCGRPSTRSASRRRRRDRDGLLRRHARQPAAAAGRRRRRRRRDDRRVRGVRRDFGLRRRRGADYRAFAFWLPTIPGAIALLPAARAPVRRAGDEDAAAATIQSEVTPERE